MNGMWMTVAAEFLDRNKLSAWSISINVGTARNPVWEPQPDVLGISFPLGSRMIEFMPIPNLDLDAVE